MDVQDSFRPSLWDLPRRPSHKPALHRCVLLRPGRLTHPPPPTPRQSPYPEHRRRPLLDPILDPRHQIETGRWLGCRDRQDVATMDEVVHTYVPHYEVRTGLLDVQPRFPREVLNLQGLPCLN